MQGKSSLPGSRRVHAGLGRHGRHYGARPTLEEASGTHRQPPKFDVPESDAGFLHRSSTPKPQQLADVLRNSKVGFWVFLSKPQGS
jgi:hypothetical protein